MLFSHNFMKKLFKVTDGSKIGSRDKVLKMSIVFNLFLNPLGPIPQNGQTDSNDSSAIFRRIV